MTTAAAARALRYHGAKRLQPCNNAELSKVLKCGDFHPPWGCKSTAVDEANDEGMNVTHDKTGNTHGTAWRWQDPHSLEGKLNYYF